MQFDQCRENDTGILQIDWPRVAFEGIASHGKGAIDKDTSNSDVMHSRVTSDFWLYSIGSPERSPLVADWPIPTLLLPIDARDLYRTSKF